MTCYEGKVMQVVSPLPPPLHSGLISSSLLGDSLFLLAQRPTGQASPMWSFNTSLATWREHPSPIGDLLPTFSPSDFQSYLRTGILLFKIWWFKCQHQSNTGKRNSMKAPLPLFNKRFKKKKHNGLSEFDKLSLATFPTFLCWKLKSKSSNKTCRIWI